MRLITIVAECFMIAFGAFLVVDRLFLHLLYFAYQKVSLSWLDAYFDHWMIGLVLVGIGIYALHHSTRPEPKGAIKT